MTRWWWVENGRVYFRDADTKERPVSKEKDEQRVPNEDWAVLNRLYGTEINHEGDAI